MSVGSLATVIVVDDDPSVREALGRLFRSVGLEVRLHGSVAETAAAPRPDGAACLVLDVRLPGLGGLEFQSKLAQDGVRLPIVFMTGHGDVPMSVRAMKAGAVDFLTKPFRDQDMLEAVAAAIDADRKARRLEDSAAELRARYERLTPREREVMTLVAQGLMNKQIAGALGVSEVTVKIHRGHMMQKLEARSVVDVIIVADSLSVRRFSSKV
jgi:FixJ family two-component response regulator